MIENSENINPCKTLQDILDRNIFERRAMIHWTEMSLDKKKKKGFKYNKVLKHTWNIHEDFQWLNEYFALDELQRRLLLKKELINAYNNLNDDDRLIVNQYLNIRETVKKWICLNSDEKKNLIKGVFNFF